MGSDEVVRDGRTVMLDRWLILRIDRSPVAAAWGPFATGQEP